MTTRTDLYGFPMSTADAVAAEACDAGVQSFVAWRADAIGRLDAAIAADAALPLPKIVKAWIMHAARAAKFNPFVDALLADVQPRLAEATPRERILAQALRVTHGGNLQGGVSVIEPYLAENPTDILAHRLLQFELFWSGESQWMRDIVERAAPAWNDNTPGFAHFQAVRAFSNEEAGDYDTAERCGRDSVARDPESAWGAHAVAHVLVMQGRIDDGVDWMEGLSGNWGRVNQIGHHNWWHLCLFLIERGACDRVLDLLDTKVRNPESPLVQAMPDATIDLQNVASLLKRLELRGVDIGDRWDTIADICANRIGDQDNPFTSAHDAMALAAAGRFDLVEELAAKMGAEGAVPGVLGNTTRAIGVPLVQAMAAHARGEYGRVVDLLWPVRRDMHMVGGSHAQRDIFFQMMVDAAMRSGRLTELRILLDDIAGIGFGRVTERTLYREAAALAA
jgi:hypothetical protein